MHVSNGETGASGALAGALIDARTVDLGGFTVGRVLPALQRRTVGPFVFFDHMGPAAFAPGAGLDVRPHPHINLATVTYLFEGEILHRDSIGSEQVIRPGAINWMTAGRGIAHSERTPSDLRKAGSAAHGLQLWVALPREHEESEPTFHHHRADSLPSHEDAGSRVRVLVGTAFGMTSPVRTFSPMFYVEAFLPAGGRLPLPAPRDYPERAAYVVAGSVGWGVERIAKGQMMVFDPSVTEVLEAETPAHVILIGGAPLDGPRHIWWNFVSSSPERIERAKADWQSGRFGKIPGDDQEFIPLPVGR
jgi:redox-sensitive bicupin YhaK (pirin superfamily)